MGLGCFRVSSSFGSGTSWGYSRVGFGDCSFMRLRASDSRTAYEGN